MSIRSFLVLFLISFSCATTAGSALAQGPEQPAAESEAATQNEQPSNTAGPRSPGTAFSEFGQTDPIDAPIIPQGMQAPQQQWQQGALAPQWSQNGMLQGGVMQRAQASFPPQVPPAAVQPPPAVFFPQAPGAFMPYNPVAPQSPPGSFQNDTAKLDNSPRPETPKEGLFGSALKTLLSGGVRKNLKPAERPWWIPGNAFTNDSMVAPYHNMDIFWWDKRAMPDKPQWVRLATSVSRYWRGYIMEPCFVYVEPFPQVPGNFTFHSRQPNGPRGWLQALAEPDGSGFPQYRYWLDQP